MRNDRVPRDWLDEAAQWLLDGGDRIVTLVSVVCTAVAIAVLIHEAGWLS